VNVTGSPPASARRRVPVTAVGPGQNQPVGQPPGPASGGEPAHQRGEVLLGPEVADGDHVGLGEMVGLGERGGVTPVERGRVGG